MKRLFNFLSGVEQSIAAFETPDKKMEQLEFARKNAPLLLNGIWLTLAIGGIDLAESTIPIPAKTS